jgi:RNA polymerase sigma-70 factor (ECF subfamily)
LPKNQRERDDRLCDKALTAIASGDQSGAEVIYRIYGRMIYSVALQILQSHDSAEDVVQEVLVAVMKHAASYKKSTNPRAWVMAIARNKAMDHFRVFKDCLPEETISDRDTISSANVEESVLLADALASLSCEERLLVNLKTYIGLSHKEIASVMNITESNAQKRYERAIAKLRRYFEE